MLGRYELRDIRVLSVKRSKFSIVKNEPVVRDPSLHATTPRGIGPPRTLKRPHIQNNSPTNRKSISQRQTLRPNIKVITRKIKKKTNTKCLSEIRTNRRAIVELKATMDKMFAMVSRMANGNGVNLPHHMDISENIGRGTGDVASDQIFPNIPNRRGDPSSPATEAMNSAPATPGEQINTRIMKHELESVEWTDPAEVLLPSSPANIAETLEMNETAMDIDFDLSQLADSQNREVDVPPLISSSTIFTKLEPLTESISLENLQLNSTSKGNTGSGKPRCGDCHEKVAQSKLVAHVLEVHMDEARFYCNSCGKGSDKKFICKCQKDHLIMDRYGDVCFLEALYSKASSFFPYVDLSRRKRTAINKANVPAKGKKISENDCGDLNRTPTSRPSRSARRPR